MIHYQKDKYPLPEHVFISSKFALVDNWSAEHAAVELAPTKYNCKDLCPVDKRPTTLLFSSTKPLVLMDTAKLLAEGYRQEVEKGAVGELADKCSVIEAAQKQKRKHVAEKARTARTVASVEKKKARRVSLESGAEL